MNKFKTGRILKQSPARRSRDKANGAKNNRFQISGNSLGSRMVPYSGGEQQQAVVVATESSMGDLLEKFVGDANGSPPSNQ